MALSDVLRPVSAVVIASGAGSTDSRVAGILVLGSPRIVKVAFWPGVTFVMSASEIGNLDDRRRGLVGVDALALGHQHRDNGAADGSGDLGARQRKIGVVDGK